MIPQMPFRFYGSLEASFLTAAEPTSYAYSPRSSVYSSSTALYEQRGPQTIEPHPPTRRAASEDGQQTAPASESHPTQGEAAEQSKAPSEPSSSRSSSRNSSPKRPMSVDLLSSAPRMNATRLMG